MRWCQNWWGIQYQHQHRLLRSCPGDATNKASHVLPRQPSVPWYSLNLPEVFKAWQPLGQGMDTSFPKVIF